MSEISNVKTSTVFFDSVFKVVNTASYAFYLSGKKTPCYSKIIFFKVCFSFQHLFVLILAPVPKNIPTVNQVKEEELHSSLAACDIDNDLRLSSTP